jgi:2-oxoglutarate dehydrogenase E2 component (dihydrolipoamide succinyltransferase)
MSTEVRVPQLPESVADATLVTWHKKPGDTVRRDENLADLETDKVVLEVPSPVTGVLREVHVASGVTVISGALLATIEVSDVAQANSASEASPAVKSATAVEARAPSGSGARPAKTEGKAEAKLAPAAKRLMEENHLSAQSVAGSGRDGRISKQDVVQALRDAPAVTAAPIAAAVAAGARGEQRVPMTRLRARIAARLVEAQATQALLTTFNEVDMQALNQARARYKDRFEKTHGVKLGFMSFFVKAAIEALKRFPAVNAYVDGGDIVYHDYFDIGVAVSTERGLVVPVLKNPDEMSFADIERGIGEFAKKAREGAITMEDLSGGTFSITNGGVFGSLLSTPIVNAPQSAILGMHKVQDRPVVVDGAIVIRPMMYLALTYDHRLVDGREAVQFLVAIKDCLEDPTRLLLHI